VGEIFMRIGESTIIGVPLISASGDLDHEAKHAILAVLDRMFRVPDPPRHLLFDLTDCEFIDSGGISVLLSMLDRLPADGWLGLVGVTSGPARALRYTGFLDLERVRFFSSLDEVAVSLAAEKGLARAQERVDRTNAAREAAAGKAGQRAEAGGSRPGTV
jgi:anti-anti-sigma factor